MRDCNTRLAEIHFSTDNRKTPLSETSIKFIRPKIWLKIPNDLKVLLKPFNFYLDLYLDQIFTH